MGALLGTAQWLVLRHIVKNAGWWILACVLVETSMIFVTVFNSYLIEFDPEYTNNISITILRYVILIVRMLCECLFLGLIMVWLLKKPKSSYPVVDSV